MGGATRLSDRERIALSAASMRLVLGLCGMVLLPLVYPKTATWWWLFAVYIVLGAVTLVLIRKRLGGLARTLIGGMIDLAVVSFIVHRLGSPTTMLVSLYLLVCIMNVLAVGRRFGLGLAVLAAVMYGGLLGAETLGWIPHGPDAPAWATTRIPDPVVVAWTWAISSIVTLTATGVAGMLLGRLRRRERELERANQQLAEANQRLDELSKRDPLTQLFNRRHLMERIEAELARVRRGGSLAVVMLDLDHFKGVNDVHGHLTGDGLLQKLARALSASTREMDVAGRYGGDEFVVLMPGTDAAQARTAAQRLVDAIREVGTTFDAQRPVTASAGVSVARADDAPRPLLQRADQASYRAKEAGGDRVMVAEAIAG